ncbi:Predicted arabinose efflux permease, MFS family [Prauserella marina]|uniref:Predicted arabinose efflux permease, MFS family n=1 Tax=Prauserella marina TaxID=530584 RepID=A0A1G6MMT3_9PSEU|nr:MFS transporter [Prauserella marina]PWV85353.1 putative MFS family arabinose efflux permease [Prauserella marina]SDC56820.1 Predicted arabinose efflux permease, MFS family [Prauserella marina]
MLTDTTQRSAGRFPGWLLCLLIATFAVGTDDFVIAGVLPRIANDLDVGEASAGQLVSVFSIVYAVSAPVLATLTARLPRRILFCGALFVFTAANVAAAFAPSFVVLMVLRIVAAVAAATVTPVAFALAASMSPAHRVGRNIGLVAAGLTMALVAGVPAGTWIGTQWSWRGSFLLVAALGVAAIAIASTGLRDQGTADPVPLRDRLRLLGSTPVLIGVAGTTLGGIGGLMTYTYIAPIVRDLSGAGSGTLAILIGVTGIAGAVGTAVGGRLTDRWGADRTLLLGLKGQVAASAALTAFGFAWQGNAPLPLTAAAFALWGFAGWAFNPPMNARLLALAPGAGTEAVALNTSGLYLGIALGGGIGGLVLPHHGGGGVVLAATVFGVLTVGLLTASIARYPATARAA